MNVHAQSDSEAETRALAAQLAGRLRGGDCVALDGPLGCGKTCFVRGLAEGLGLDRVGMRDGFVALGGNSLLATQLVSRMRDLFQLDLPLKLCLNLPLGDLAGELERAGREAGVDVGEVAEVFIQIDELSDTEVRTVLEEGV